MKIYWVTAGIALTLAGTSALAQTTTATQSTTAASQSTSDMGTGMMGTTPDFSALIDSPYSYTKLVQAKARGLSEAQIASVARISRQTGVSFTEIVDAVLRGTTFFSLAQRYNLPLADVLNVQDEEARIAAYKAAYEKTDGFVLNDYRMMAYHDAELDAMEARYQSLYGAFPSTAVGAAMTFPVTPPPPAPVYVAPAPPVLAPMPVHAPPPMPAPMPAPKAVVHKTVAVHTVTAHTAPVRQRRVLVRHKRHIVPRRRVRPVKRIIIGS